MNKRRWLYVIVLGLILVLSALATGFGHAKFKALKYHDVDFPFYAQFAARMADPGLSEHYSLNVNGLNFLGFHGAEGSLHFHQAIHYEPVKYIYPLLYNLLPGTEMIQWFIALVYFLPLLYLLRLISRYTDYRALLLFCMVLYAVFPSVFPLITFDLRPYIFFIPVVFCGFLAVVLRCSFREVMIWFNLLFLIREEALVFGAVMAAHRYFSTVDRRRALRELIQMGLVYLGWAAVIFGYFLWTGNGFTIYLYQSALLMDNLVMAAVAVVVSAVLALGLLWWLWHQPYRLVVLRVVSLAAVFIPLSAQTMIDVGRMHLGEKSSSEAVMALLELALHPRMVLYSVLGLCLAVLIWTMFRSVRKILSVLGGVVLLSCVLLHMHPEFSVWKTYQTYIQRAEQTAPVFDVREASDRYESGILTDYVCYQAFYDFEHVYVYKRVPWHLAPGSNRYFALNMPVLTSLLSNRIDRVVIQHDSLPALDLIDDRSAFSFTAAISNQEFQIMRIAGPER